MKTVSLRVAAPLAGKFSAQSASWSNLSAAMVIIISKHCVRDNVLERERGTGRKQGQRTEHTQGLLMVIRPAVTDAISDE